MRKDLVPLHIILRPPKGPCQAPELPRCCTELGLGLYPCHLYRVLPPVFWMCYNLRAVELSGWPEGKDATEETSGSFGEPQLPAETASRYCPNCSQPLQARSCKLVCPLCGYYMSCSDFY